MTQTGPSHVLVGLSDGRAIKARRVVCCLGPSGRFRIPSWAMPFRSSSPLHDASPHTPTRGRGSGGAANPMDDDDDEEEKGDEDGSVDLEGRILHSHELPRYRLLTKRRGHTREKRDRKSIYHPD